MFGGIANTIICKTLIATAVACPGALSRTNNTLFSKLFSIVYFATNNTKNKLDHSLKMVFVNKAFELLSHITGKLLF